MSIKEMNDHMNRLRKCRKGIESVKTGGYCHAGISLEGTCLLSKRRAAQRRHEFNAGVCMELGNPRTDVKGGYQAEDPQDTEYQCSHGDRPDCSSGETPVMGAERRIRVIQFSI